MPITWRNVDASSNAAANSLLVAGSDRIGSALGALTREAEQQGALNNANYDVVAKQNTTDALARLNSINNSADLAKEMAKGGALSTDALDSSFGKQYNKGALSEATTSKLTGLISAEKSLADKNKMEGERLADRLENQRKDKIKEGQSNQLYAWSVADHNTKMASIARGQAYDANASEIIRSSASKEDALAKLAKLSLDINKDGLLPAEQMFAKEKSFTDQINGVGLSAAGRAQAAFEQGQATKLTSDLGARHDKVLNEYRKSAGFDLAIEQMATDQMTVGDAIVNLEKQIKDKGVTNTIPIAARVEEINNAFEKNGLDLPNGKLVQEILTQGGHDDKFLGFDAKFELNRQFMNNVIAKVKKNSDYKSLNAENEAAFLKAKAEGSDAILTALTQNAAEREQEAYANRFTNQVKVAELVPIEGLQAKLEMDLKELRKTIKPKSVPDPVVIDTTPDPKAPADAAAYMKSIGM